MTELCANCYRQAHNVTPDMGMDLDWRTAPCTNCKKVTIVFKEIN